MAREEKIPTPVTRMLDDFRRGPLTFLVWFMAVGALYVMFARRASQFEFTGVARAPLFEISSEVDATLKAVMVDLYEDVEAGQIVAQLDDEQLAAQIEVARATIGQLSKEIEAQMAQLRTDENERLGKSQADFAGMRAAEDRLHLESLAIKAQLETDRIEQQRLDLELARMKQMVEEKVTAQQEYDLVRLRHEENQRQIDENTSRLAQTQTAWRAARSQREQYAGQSDASADFEVVLQPLRESIRVQELMIEELSIARKSRVLRAPVSGQVVQVLCLPGQGVEAAEAIMLIGQRTASEVVGYIADSSAAQVAENMPVEIARMVDPGKAVAATVHRVSPTIELLPQQLWLDTNRPKYGRPFVVSLAAPFAIVPGEKILIRNARTSSMD